MDKSLLTSNLTEERIKKYLLQGKRFDKRQPDEYRDIKVETGVSKKAEGSAKITLGKTQVVVGIKMDVVTPYPDAANKGNLMTTAELLPLSSPRFESGPPKFPAIELGRVIDRGIRESKFIDFEQLCIKEGEKVWNVFIDIYSLNDDGNIMDAAAIGAIIALKNAKIPKYDEESEKVLYGEWTEQKLPLSENIPIAITIHKIGDKIMVDPTREEEDVSDTRVTIGRTDEIISSIQKGNSGTLTDKEFEQVLEMSEKAREKVFKNIEEHLK